MCFPTFPPSEITFDQALYFHEQSPSADMKSKGFPQKVPQVGGILELQSRSTMYFSTGAYNCDLSYRNMSGSLGEQEMPWEHEPWTGVSTAFMTSPNFHECFYSTIRLRARVFYEWIVNEAQPS